MAGRLIVSLLAVGLALAHPLAKADVRTFYFGGQVTGFHDPLALSPFSFGDRFDGWYSFETGTPGEFPRGYDAVYTNALSAASIIIGGSSYSSGPAAPSMIYVENAGLHPEITSDYYQVFGEGLVGPAIGGSPFAPNFFLAVRDHSGNMLADLSLPTSAPNVVDLSQTTFTLGLRDGGGQTLYFANGALSYLSAAAPVPEPESYALLVAGLLLMALRRAGQRRVLGRGDL